MVYLEHKKMCEFVICVKLCPCWPRICVYLRVMFRCACLREKEATRSDHFLFHVSANFGGSPTAHLIGVPENF